MSAEYLTSFVFKFGVDLDELDPERDGGRSWLAGLELPGLSPFSPTLSLPRFESAAE